CWRKQVSPSPLPSCLRWKESLPFGLALLRWTPSGCCCSSLLICEHLVRARLDRKRCRGGNHSGRECVPRRVSCAVREPGSNGPLPKVTRSVLSHWAALPILPILPIVALTV